MKNGIMNQINLIDTKKSFTPRHKPASDNDDILRNVGHFFDS